MCLFCDRAHGDLQIIHYLTPVIFKVNFKKSMANIVSPQDTGYHQYPQFLHVTPLKRALE